MKDVRTRVEGKVEGRAYAGEWKSRSSPRQEWRGAPHSTARRHFQTRQVRPHSSLERSAASDSSYVKCCLFSRENEKSLTYHSSTFFFFLNQDH